jgi:hypothetical protein
MSEDDRGYGPAPKVGQQETNLLNQLADLNENRLAMGYGRLPSGTDTATLVAIELVQKIGFSMRTADGIARPFPIPSRVAYEIVLALRGERVQTPGDDGLPVPSR